MTATSHATALTLLRLCLGVFFVFEGIGKASWLLDSSQLAGQLSQMLARTTPINRWYVETICLPGVALFARLVPLGEFATGIAFLSGVYVRPAAILAFFMVMNFHFANGILFRYQFLTNGYALPVLGGLLALALGGNALPWRLRRLR
jgi:uncharacterized membrane protein YphA (DoxX/SURF4 family)